MLAPAGILREPFRKQFAIKNHFGIVPSLQNIQNIQFLTILMSKNIIFEKNVENEFWPVLTYVKKYAEFNGAIRFGWNHQKWWVFVDFQFCIFLRCSSCDAFLCNNIPFDPQFLEWTQLPGEKESLTFPLLRGINAYQTWRCRTLLQFRGVWEIRPDNRKFLAETISYGHV